MSIHKNKGTNIHRLHERNRIYELVVSGRSNLQVKQIMKEEYNMAAATTENYLVNMRHEVREVFNEKRDDMFLNMINELYLIKNQTLVIGEKIKCLELIAKLMGFGAENINITNERVDKNFTIELRVEKKEGEE